MVKYKEKKNKLLQPRHSDLTVVNFWILLGISLIVYVHVEVCVFTKIVLFVFLKITIKLYVMDRFLCL